MIWREHTGHSPKRASKPKDTHLDLAPKCSSVSRRPSSCQKGQSFYRREKDCIGEHPHSYDRLFQIPFLGYSDQSSAAPEEHSEEFRVDPLDRMAERMNHFCRRNEDKVDSVFSCSKEQIDIIPEDRESFIIKLTLIARSFNGLSRDEQARAPWLFYLLRDLESTVRI